MNVAKVRPDMQTKKDPREINVATRERKKVCDIIIYIYFSVMCVTRKRPRNLITPKCAS